jgi:hypothetical protein
MDPKLFSTKKLTKGLFVERSIKTHGDKYDYSLVNYKNSATKVIINCLTHGPFEQRPNTHLRGHGCPVCSNNNKLTTESFIEKSIKIHGDKYGYDLVDYKNNHTKINIICKKHGVFNQTPNVHLNGSGCVLCSGLERSTTECFIKKSIKIHGDKYDYTFVEYVNNKTKVEIVCPLHGTFNQRPDSHLRGVGCTSCNTSKGELKIENFLKNKKIEYIKQKTFFECTNKKPLPFDFYLPNYNLCIEYDGLQHFLPRKKFGGELGYSRTKNNDLIKNIYCLNSNIKLLRIKYDDTNWVEKINFELNN